MGVIMREACDLCADAGTLRDGSACPRCSLSVWRERDQTADITRPKRTVWIRAASGHVIQRDPVVAPLQRPVSIRPRIE
jgi:hypothetical protein